MFRAPEKERGAALLTVLLLVAVMAVIAATALDRLQLSTRLAVNGAAMTQARYYSYAAENIAVSRLEDLLARQPEQITLKGNWLDTETPIPVNQGLATARLKDSNNCFNLNSLVLETDNPLDGQKYFVNSTAIKQFSQLMMLLQVPEYDADVIAQSAADWIDSDGLPSPAGGEDDHYRGLATPLLPPNQLMADRSEILSVRGVTPAIYARMKDWICAVPKTGLTKININTLSPNQSILFAMLLDGKVSIGEAKAILARRPADGYGSLVRFWNEPRLAKIKPSSAVQEQVRLKSEFFQLQLKIIAGDVELESRALIDASKRKPFVLSRSWGEAG